MNLKQTWRWFGPKDPVKLRIIKQAGAQGIVTALHDIPHGEIWPLEEIKKRKAMIEAAGLTWEVVESVNVGEPLKTRSGNYQELLENYRITLRNLASCGIHTVCYNFMPVLDWTRTQLDYQLPNGAKALRLDWTDLAVFDQFILKRKGAALDFKSNVLKEAEGRFKNYDDHQIAVLKENVLMGVPGEAPSTMERLQYSIEVYKEIGREGLRENLAFFLKGIEEVCCENNIQMTIHPDDPPMDILGLPRIISSLQDLEWLFDKVPEVHNGFCFCSGSLGAGKQNDLVKILQQTADRVHFVHLRNVIKEEDNSFYESDHLEGDNDMYGLMKTLLEIQQQRKTAIPYRPDHGHQILDDLKKETNPGYSAIGRLKGLAELRGLELGILGSL